MKTVSTYTRPFALAAALVLVAMGFLVSPTFAQEANLDVLEPALHENADGPEARAVTATPGARTFALGLERDYRKSISDQALGSTGQGGSQVNVFTGLPSLSTSPAGAPGVHAPPLRVACGGAGHRPYHFSGTLEVEYDVDGDGSNESILLEGVQLRVVRAGSPLKWAQGPDATTDASGQFDVTCTFARDRNGVAPGGKKVRFKVMARFRDSEFRIRKAGWAKNNWFEVGRERGCNRSGGLTTSKCKDNEFDRVDRTFETDDTAGRHAYMWWFYNDLQDRMEQEDIGLTDRPFFKRKLTVTYPEKNVFKPGSSFLFNIHLEEGDWDATRTMIHEYMHRWDVGKLGGEGHVSCLFDAHHEEPGQWNSSRCSGFMEGFAEAAAAGLEQEWYGGNISLYSHADLRAGNLGYADAENNYSVETLTDAERTDVGWENFIELILVDNEMDVVSGSESCNPTDVGIFELLRALQADRSRKANWYEARPNASFEWFTDILETHVPGFTSDDAEMYQKLGDPSLSASEVCGSTDTGTAETALSHTVVITSDGISGETGYMLRADGEIRQVEGALAGFQVTKQSNDEVSGTMATGHVGGGVDGFVVEGDFPSIELDNPQNAEVYVDGELR